MSATTIRVDEQTRGKARALACELGVPIHEVVARAVEAYRRRCFLEAANADYAALRADPAAWAEELEERRLWDATLLDGLEHD
jgi:predicted transcriptional regulator